MPKLDDGLTDPQAWALLAAQASARNLLVRDMALRSHGPGPHEVA